MVSVNLQFTYVSNNILFTIHFVFNTLMSLITHMSESLTIYTGLRAICNRYNCLQSVHRSSVHPPF